MILPEIIIALMSGLFLVLSTAKKNPKRDYFLALGVAFLAAIICLFTLQYEGNLFSQTYRIDFFSQCFKLILLIGLVILVWFSRDKMDLETRVGSEYFYFLFSATLGFILMSSAMELITLFVALELSSIALYILIPLRKGDGPDVEAGIKYFFMSAAASAVFLYGASFLFGVAHSTDLREIAQVLAQGTVPPLFYVGLILASVAFFLKLAVVPFHFWAPDVYESSNTQVTTLIATLSKVVAVAILLRFLPIGHGSNALVFALIGLSLLSMTLGNLAAIWQQDIKRLLAYSTIAHAGYILIGFLSMNPSGYRAIFYYAVTYMITTFAVFMVVLKISKEGKNPKLTDFIGLSESSPLLALTLLLGLLSLAGIPPLVGFAAKWFIFTAAIQQGYAWLILIAFINSVISLYYYLLVIKKAYVDSSEESISSLTLTWNEKAVSLVFLVFLVVFGVFPNLILGIGEKIANHVF